MHPAHEHRLLVTRRHFLAHSGFGIGSAALAALLHEDARADLPGLPHLAPRARRVIYLFQSGAPSQLDLFDHKPHLRHRRGAELPASIRMGQRLTGMTATQERFPVAPSMYRFARHGRSGAWMSELLPHLAGVADELCFIRTLHTEAINHDPAITFFQSGAQLAGRPSMGAWLTYGLGSESRDLPAFVVLISQGTGNPADQPLYDRLWGSGFLPSQYQGVKFRSVGDPVLHLSNPAGVSDATRRRILDDLARLNELRLAETGDPETQTRIAQYELAYRMQSAVPALTDLSTEPRHVLEIYGPDVTRPGTFAANCLLRADWPSAACALSSSSIAAGTSTRTYRGKSPANAATPTSRRPP